MSSRSAVYLDFNAAAPLHPRVKEAIAAFLETSEFPGNPSSTHASGRKAKAILGEARERVAASWKVRDADGLLFASSGSEANQLAVLAGRGRAPKNGKDVWVLSPVEHDSTRQLRADWEKAGGQALEMKVDRNGVLSFTDEIEEKIREGRVALVSLVWANNETGVLTDLEPIAKACSASGVPLHVDGAQAWGKIPINLSTLPVDYFSASGHKIGALSGTGVLWKRTGMPFHDPILPGKQEKGRRGGTENVLGALSLGIAASHSDPAAFEARCFPLRESFEAKLKDGFPEVRLHGEESRRIANTSCFHFPGFTGASLQIALDLEGFSVSSGSACSSGALEPSHVLTAMGVPPEEALASIRVSIGTSTRAEELDSFLAALLRLKVRAQKIPGRQAPRDSVQRSPV